MPVLPSWMRPPLWSSRTWLTVGPQRGQFSTSTSSRHTSSGGAASVRDTEKSGDMRSMLPDGEPAALASAKMVSMRIAVFLGSSPAPTSTERRPPGWAARSPRPGTGSCTAARTSV